MATLALNRTADTSKVKNDFVQYKLLPSAVNNIILLYILVFEKTLRIYNLSTYIIRRTIFPLAIHILSFNVLCFI